MKYLPILLILFAASCTPQKQLQRAQKRLDRITGNFPELAQTEVKQIDLLFAETDTFYTPERLFDTTYVFKTDTVFKSISGGLDLSIEKSGDTVRVITRVLSDTIIVNDTVRLTYNDTVKVFKVQPISGKQIWHYRGQGALWLFIALLILIIIILALRLYLKGQLPFLRL